VLLAAIKTLVGLLRQQNAQKGRQQGRSERRPEAYPLGYVEDLSEARTTLPAFFSILLEDFSILT
jgi:hypothetical protein